MSSTIQEVEIPYSSEKIILKFPIDLELDILKPNIDVSGKKFNLALKINQILEDEYWKTLQNSNVLLVVNDATRATPTGILLEKIDPLFEKFSISVDFIIATGSHRKPSNEELVSIFGANYEKYQTKIFIHEAKNEDELVSIGVTSFNTEIKLNKLLFDTKYTSILTINSIEPHYFAGWTGGRKSIVPGLAGYTSITKTHIHALSKESQNCRLQGNPVHDDLQEGFDLFLKKIANKFYTFQFVLDSQGTIHELFAGNYSVFEKGVQFASKIFQVPIKREYDLVIAVAYPPLDQDLYQSHKALENSKQAINKALTNKKSHFILISPCEKGMGPDQFLIPLKNYAHLSYKESMNEISNNYKLGFHKAGKILEAEEYANLHLFSELDQEKAAEAHFVKINGNLNDFIKKIVSQDNIKNIALILDACVTVPVRF